MMESFYSICKAVEQDDPCMTLVNLNCAGLGNDGCRLLAKALQQNTHVVVLFLNQNGFHGTSQAWYDLVSIIAKHPTLEYLYLSHNPNLSNHGVTLLAQALSKHRKSRRSRLKVLKLTHCQIGNAGARALSWWLEEDDKCNLKTLDLQHNHVGPMGALACAKALKRNSTLETLDLRFNMADLEDCCNGTAGGGCCCCASPGGLCVESAKPCWWNELATVMQQGNATLSQLQVTRIASVYQTSLPTCQERVQLYTMLNSWGRKSFGNPHIPSSAWVRLLGRCSATTKQDKVAAASSCSSRGGTSLLYKLIRSRPDLVLPASHAKHYRPSSSSVSASEGAKSVEPKKMRLLRRF